MLKAFMWATFSEINILKKMTKCDMTDKENYKEFIYSSVGDSIEAKMIHQTILCSQTT